ncbi:hypothetical protein FCT18_03950 [Lysinibacillus sphaericus]|uniref:Uncharacterized protein n=4 Tax=Lysinibacillus TaxID=400634 RepID=A0A2S5CXJ4_LYSSH|nr:MULTISPECIES: hypothetical protein [Lysinibacillus]AHN22737.1 membrane protein [Lysinibacillus varians]AVK96049.1 hypothetical protein LS41612_07190 [Lysinibacillus sphaericus]MCS1383736.1 hypothetical protein [Lysinibacillus sphaericus]MED4544676.1 hypothetical protein [Lysinibacillus sphaericus]OEC03486.1 membrane protein [Lysinibacillus sphaericus]
MRRRKYNPWLLPPWLRQFRFYCRTIIVPICGFQFIRVIIIPTSGDLIILLLLLLLCYLLLKDII